MKIANGEIRAWETIKMTFSTCREKSGTKDKINQLEKTK
jgi:hypothetical protein